MGRVETSPSTIPFMQIVNPTDFDFAVENMRLRIKQTSTFWEGWNLLGAWSGPLKRFLTSYIEMASTEKSSYSPLYKSEWVSMLINKYPKTFEKENLEKYFDVFYKLYQEKQIPENIYRPFNYTPEKTDILNLETTVKKTTNKLLLTVVLGIGIYGFASGGFRYVKKGK